MNIKVTKITIITDRNGPDYVYLTLDAVSTMYPFKDPPQAKVAVASGGGEEWVKKTFPDIPVEVINSSSDNGKTASGASRRPSTI